MLDASSAKKITKESTITVKDVLEDISKKIKENAYKGESELRYYCNKCSWRNDDTYAYTYKRPFVELIITELTKHGYNAKITSGEKYKLAGSYEEFYNVFLLIEW